MKLNNTKKTSTSHNNEDSIYKQIADTFGDRIFLMMHVAKDEQSVRYNFHGPGRVGRMAGMIAAKVPGVKTVSDVYRAAMYLGLSIIYNMLLKDPTEETACFFTQIVEGEKINQQVQLIDQCLYLVAQYFLGFQAGVTSEDELNDKVSELVSQLPKGLRKIAQENINQVLKGVPFTQISKIRRPGRPIKVIGYDEDY